MEWSCLSSVSSDVIQKIYQCLFEAVGEDYQEAESHLNLETHVSKPFLIWDLIYRNLIHTFTGSNVIYSTKKRGMWEVMLLYDKCSKTVLSFIKDSRFSAIRKAKAGQQPQYIRALLTLNSGLQAKRKQQRLFPDHVFRDDSSELAVLLDDLCKNFMEPVLGEIPNHVMVAFSANYGQITSLKAYVLDKDLDAVDEEDWLERSKPILSNEVVKATDETLIKQPRLKKKAMERVHQKELVGLKQSKDEKDMRS